MRFEDVDDRTEGTFLRCLHDEIPEDPRVMALRRKWFDSHRRLGLRARVLVDDSGDVVGLSQCIPVEHSHLEGQGLLAILCLWAHGYEHHVGNRQGNGYGRYMLESIEREAWKSGFSGVVAWGMDFPYWNPVSFYEHMEYVRADKVGMAVLVWKRFIETATPPSFLRERRPLLSDTGKPSVMAFVNGWCTGACSQCVTAREAVEGLETLVDYQEIDTSSRDALRDWGVSDGVFVNGQPYRPYDPPFTADMLRRDLLRLAGEGGGC